MKQSGDAGREMVFLNNATCPEQNSIYSLDTFHLREKGGAIYMTAGKWWEYLELSFFIQASKYLYCKNLHLDKHFCDYMLLKITR